MPSFRAVSSILFLCGLAGAVAPAPALESPPTGEHLSTLIVPDYFPYTFINPQGEPDGFGVELIRAVGKEIGSQVDIHPATWEQAQAALAFGEIDLLPMISYSAERERRLDFTPPHTVVHDAIFSRKGDDRYPSLDDLKGKRVVTLKDDLAYQYLHSSGAAANLDLLAAATHQEGLRWVSEGTADALLAPRLAGLLQLRRLEIDNLEATAAVAGYERAFCIATNKGNRDLLARLTEGLALVKANGVYGRIYTKWFGAVEPVPWLDHPTIRTIGWSLGSLVLAALLLFGWNLSLRHQVTTRTRTLEQEIAERRRLEASLAQNAERLNLAIRATGVGVWDWDIQADRLEWDDAMYALYGLSRATYPRGVDAWQAAIHPDDRAAAIGDSQAAIRGEREYDCEFRIVRPDGTVRIIKADALVTWGAGGTPLHMIGVNRDITDERQAVAQLQAANAETARLLAGADQARRALLSLVEDQRATAAALRRSEQRLAAAQAQAHLGSWEYDPATGEAIWSDEMFRLLGLDPATTPPSRKRFLSAVHPDDRPEVYRMIQEAEEQRRRYVQEFRILRPDGSERWLVSQGEPLLDEQGRLQRMAGTRQDITERKLAEQSLSRSELRYRQLVEGMSDIVYEYSSRHGALYWSPQAESMLGFSEEMLKSNPMLWHDAIHPEDLHQINALIADSAPGTRLEMEYRLRDARGIWHWISDRAIVKEGASAGEIIFAGIARDISRQKATEEALRQAQRMETVGQLAGGLAHDFNNLLGIIIGNLDFLEMMAADNPKLAERVANATRAALRGADLTRQLLNFARPNAGNPQVLDINQAIQSMEELIARSVTPAIQVETRLDPSAWPVEVDPGEFEDALLNLVVNARDAMPTGGTLTLSTTNCTLEPGHFEAEPMAPDGAYLEIDVADAGIGIEPALLERVFDPFFTTKPKGRGTGLGLSMVYGFVRRAKGHIRVESPPGQGARFRLYIPRTAGATGTISTAGSAAPVGGNETILVVDDEEGLRSLAVEQLGALGYHTLSAADGHQALALLEGDAAIDLLFSDVVMPGGMDGHDLATRALKRRPNLKVLLTSGYTHREEVSQFELLDKPYTGQELGRRVRSVLDGD